MPPSGLFKKSGAIRFSIAPYRGWPGAASSLSYDIIDGRHSGTLFSPRLTGVFFI